MCNVKIRKIFCVALHGIVRIWCKVGTKRGVNSKVPTPRPLADLKIHFISPTGSTETRRKKREMNKRWEGQFGHRLKTFPMRKISMDSTSIWLNIFTFTIFKFAIFQDKLQIMLFICVQTDFYLEYLWYYALFSCYHAVQFVIFLFTWLQNLILEIYKNSSTFVETLSLDSLAGVLPPDLTGNFRTQAPRLGAFILFLSSGHDQDAKGVERKGNGIVCHTAQSTRGSEEALRELRNLPSGVGSNAWPKTVLVISKCNKILSRIWN